MKNLNIRKILIYVVIALMVPTFIIALFMKNKFPVLGPGLAVGGLVLLTLITFIDKKK